MKRNRELEIHILVTVRADEGLISTLSYKDFDGVNKEEFFYHCKLLKEEELVEGVLANGGVAHIGLTARGHDYLDALEQDATGPSRKLGF